MLVSFIPRVTPIFTVSCVTGENLNLVKKFLNLVPPSRSPMDQEKLAQELTEYQVWGSFVLPLVSRDRQRSRQATSGAGEGNSRWPPPFVACSLFRSFLPTKMLGQGIMTFWIRAWLWQPRFRGLMYHLFKVRWNFLQFNELITVNVCWSNFLFGEKEKLWFAEIPGSLTANSTHR